MKSLVVLFLLFCSCTSHASLPADAPDVAIVVTSCNQIVGVILVMPDGTRLVIDKDSGEDAAAVKAFAERSKTPPAIYEVGCYRVDPVLT